MESHERAIVPTGISGDFEPTEIRSRTTELVAESAVSSSLRDELVMKVNLGTATPEEERRLLSMFSADTAHLG